MRERIGALEDLSDQLYYCTCFLIENLPELILKTIHSDFTANRTLEYLNVSPQPNAIWESCHPPLNDKPLPSRREKDVLELLAKGYCVKEIARQLYISETTVITHKKNLKKKFNVKNMVELISKISTIK
jgi:DNA-binding NarL/FixJ family response regulator